MFVTSDPFVSAVSESDGYEESVIVESRKMSPMSWWFGLTVSDPCSAQSYVVPLLAVTDWPPANGVVTLQLVNPSTQWPAVSATPGAMIEPEQYAASDPLWYMSTSAASG